MNNKVQKELSDIGIKNTLGIIYNPSYEVLYDEENSIELEGFEKGQKTEFGAVNVMTGIYTGRSPKDKYILKDSAGREVDRVTKKEYKEKYGDILQRGTKKYGKENLQRRLYIKK